MTSMTDGRSHPGDGSGDRFLELRSPTEERNPRTEDIDTLGTLELLERINDEDARVAAVVRQVLPHVASLVDVTVERLGRGGHVHYFGAGSSGRLGLLDAAELPPTFGVGYDLVVAHLAGGDGAVRRALEGAEDDEAHGSCDAGTAGPADVAIGIAASGYTRYVGGALRSARAAGAHTALITSNPVAPLASLADTVVCVDTGPEVITGSTRMKSATAQKLVLNAFSTAVMIRTGRTWSNLMVDVVSTNAKLQGRVVRLLRQATGLSQEICEQALADAGEDTKIALIMLRAGVTPEQARSALAAYGGIVAAALRALGAPARSAAPA